ncbi:unnamed protein product [Brachionus calyciflorus]|uniref:Late endosomal/lysosomal adaptor and MAPK and MTOR activator 5 n=1 Tax=Brachionus calyciflorus TaxID=104777 RepID=A0A813M474_9BILA|nr:unnamed protein product [Brachionus calyciflorus]
MTEERLEEIITQTLDTNGVVGAMIIDTDGLCLACKFFLVLIQTFKIKYVYHEIYVLKNLIKKMNRLTRLENFCEKTGIFNFKNSSFGPYGYALINQIKHEWLKFSLNKFNNNYLIENVDLLEKNASNFELNSYIEKLPNFGNNKEPIGLVNIFPNTKNESLLFKKKNNQTNLNVIYLNHDNSSDLFLAWQRERLQWWSKIAHYPEHLLIEKPDLVYHFNDSEIKNKIEKISMVKIDLAEFKNFQNLDKKLDNLVISETSAETILENILIDSVQFPDDLNLGEKLEKFNIKVKDKVYFNIDFRLAPYKICMLYTPEQTNVKSLAIDFKKIFYQKTKHNILLFELDDECNLEAKYDHLDLMGIPYSVYLPSSVSKDGICKLRSRDTTLSEETHLNLVIQQFNAILNSLTRGKSDTLLGGPITELTSLASRLCKNENPSIVLETDSCNLLIKREGLVTAAVYKQVS